MSRCSLSELSLIRPDIPPDLPTNDRQSLLLSHYMFECDCKLCTAPADKREQSDNRRYKLVQIHTILKETTNLGTVREAAAELLRLVKEEGLEFKLKEYHNDLTMAFYRLGDFDSAITNAQAALRWAEDLSGGKDDEFQRAIRANLAVLEKLRAANRST